MSIQLYLASKSPRRQELLKQLGLRFEVLTAGIVECPAAGETPAQYALRIAAAKAQAAQAQAVRNLPVLGADTDVAIEGAILGKPRDREHAVAMLLRLSGRTHKVYSAVALVQGARVETALSVTRVAFGEITREAAAAYWDTGEPADKAGAYAIQGYGAMFVREIQGSYSGVVGLPLYETAQLLKDFGITPHAAHFTPHES